MSIRKLWKCRLRATDGPIGHCRDALFDDAEWTLCYLVVSLRIWLTRRKILLAPQQVGSIDLAQRLVHVNLHRQQLRARPRTNQAEPVSRRESRRWSDHFGYSRFWAGAGAWGPLGASAMGATEPDLPLMPAGAATPTSQRPAKEPQRSAELRSCREVIGYGVEAKNGRLGHVDDWIIDSEHWNVVGLTLKSRELPRRRLVVPTSSVGRIDWLAKSVFVDESRERLAERAGPQPGAALLEQA